VAATRGPTSPCPTRCSSAPLGGGSVDHLDGVADGDETALNAKRWVYASFFNRMKAPGRAELGAGPGLASARSDWLGLRLQVTHHPTSGVTLDRSGALSKIVVTRPSGVAVLDDEATRAFQAAQPFPNPPAGLVATDNQISFDFSFHFEIGAPRTSWKIIRN
jgi:TonB family protein